MKAIAIVHAISAAHVTRPLEIAKVLRTQGHEIIFAGCGKYLEIAQMAGFKTYPLSGISSERLVMATQNGLISQLHNESELMEWVQEELEMYQVIQPDYVIVDHRITASTSAEIAGIKVVSINNAHMTMYREIPFVNLRKSFLRFFPKTLRLAERIENQFEFLFWNLVINRPMNSVRKKLGLKPKYSYHLDEGDLNLIPDCSEVNPMVNPPDHFHFVGPITWKNNLEGQELLKKLNPKQNKKQKVVYFTVGSDGLHDLLKNIKLMFDESVQVVVSLGTSVPEDLEIPSNIIIEKYVNADKLLPHCDLVVCHGGNGTIYQALSHGVPVLGIATHDEQYYGLKRIEELGLGVGLKKRSLEQNGFETVSVAAQRILNNPSFRVKAIKYQNILNHMNGPLTAAQKICEFLNVSFITSVASKDQNLDKIL